MPLAVRFSQGGPAQHSRPDSLKNTSSPRLNNKASAAKMQSRKRKACKNTTLKDIFFVFFLVAIIFVFFRDNKP